MPYLWILFISNIIVAAGHLSNSQCASTLYKTETSYALLDSLEQEQWDVEDKPCLESTLKMLNGLKNSTLWATWIWDSMQHPLGVLHGSRYQLGSFDQCMKPPWLNSHPHLRTQYCLADVRLTETAPKNVRRAISPSDSTNLYISTPSKYGRELNFLTWGVCFSYRCSTNTITKIVHAMLRTQHLPYTEPYKEIKVHSCQIAGDMKQYGFGFKLFIFILVLLVAITPLSMYYLSHVSSVTFLSRLAESFCLKRNWNSLMKINKDNIRVLDGMRFTSSIIVVVLHYLSYSIEFSINMLDVEVDVEHMLFSILLHLDVIVDTFLVMSGLLLVRSIVRHQQCGKGSLIKMLFLRYVRLIGPQAIMVLYFACTSMHIGNGPLWPYLSKSEAEDCSVNWWANLLMINNYVKTHNMCNMVSWYNACDYQLAILGTILYSTYQKNRSIGLKYFTMAFLISVISSGVITYWNQIPAVMAFSIENLGNFKTNLVFLANYIQTHHRADVYLIGMLLGHYTTIYSPKDFKNIIPKNLAIIGALITLFVMISILHYGANTVIEQYDQLSIALFVAFNRPLWACSICCLIIFCEYGTVPIIGDYLNTYIAVPLGRLSYGVYMVHMAVNYRILYSIRTPLGYSFIQTVFGSLGVLTMSYLLSCAIWHFIEAPLINVANLILDTMSQKKILENGSYKTLNNYRKELNTPEDHNNVVHNDLEREQMKTECMKQHNVNFDCGYETVKSR